MADPLYTIRRALCVVLEDTEGTDQEPAVGDVVLCRTLNPPKLNQDTVERTLAGRGFFGGFKMLPTRANFTLEFEVEMAGFGTAGPAAPTPGYDALLRICALSRTITADTKVDYAPVTTGIESASLYFYQDGQLHKMLGARGTMRCSFAKNAVPVYRFTITGLYGGVSDAAFPTVDTSAYVQPAPCVPGQTTFSLHGIATLGLESFELDLGNTLVHRNLPNITERVLITGRAATASLQIEHAKNSIYDFWAAVRAATDGAFSLTHGATAGNIVKLAIPNANLKEPDFAEQDGLVHLSLGMDVKPTAAGNDEVLLTIQ